MGSAATRQPRSDALRDSPREMRRGDYSGTLELVLAALEAGQLDQATSLLAQQATPEAEAWLVVLRSNPQDEAELFDSARALGLVGQSELHVGASVEIESGSGATPREMG